MTANDRRIQRMAERVREIAASEKDQETAWGRIYYATQRWAFMLYHEYLRRDVQVRAESLAFLMAMSILPLIAGGFLIFTVFAQFGMATDALQGAVERFLETIPFEHREFVREYILRFKDAYLMSVNKRSGSIGIFALFFLVWIGVQAFSNVDRTINIIWGSNRERPMLETLRNFLVVSVAAPVVLIAGLSIPIILNRIAVSKYVFDQVPLLFSLLNHVVAPGLIFLTFACLYKFVPVQRVQWRSALTGAVFSTVFLELSNTAMAYYFAFGTVSAYGKAAVVPLIGFWIFIVWMVVILGAEVSFLMQNGKPLFEEPEARVSLSDGKLLLQVLRAFRENFREGHGPSNTEAIATATGAPQNRVANILAYLCSHGWIAETVATKDKVDCYVLARDVDEVPLAPLLREFYGIRPSKAAAKNPEAAVWEQGLSHWLKYFEKRSLAEA